MKRKKGNGATRAMAYLFGMPFVTCFGGSGIGDSNEAAGMQESYSRLNEEVLGTEIGVGVGVVDSDNSNEVAVVEKGGLEAEAVYNKPGFVDPPPGKLTLGSNPPFLRRMASLPALLGQKLDRGQLTANLKTVVRGSPYLTDLFVGNHLVVHLTAASFNTSTKPTILPLQRRILSASGHPSSSILLQR